jgi:hypothetical protein
LFGKFNNEVTDLGATMNPLIKYGPLAITIAGTVGVAIFTPTFISAHPMAFAWVNGIAQLLHAMLPSIFQSEESQ